MIDTEFGPAQANVMAHGGLNLVFGGATIIHRVSYRSVQAWQSESRGKWVTQVIGYRSSGPGELSWAAQEALRLELERLSVLHVTPARRQAAEYAAQEGRVKRLQEEADAAEVAWYAALSALEATSVALAQHPALDTAAA